jgi:hypothetical protein
MRYRIVPRKFGKSRVRLLHRTWISSCVLPGSRRSKCKLNVTAARRRKTVGKKESVRAFRLLRVKASKRACLFNPLKTRTYLVSFTPSRSGGPSRRCYTSPSWRGRLSRTSRHYGRQALASQSNHQSGVPAQGRRYAVTSATSTRPSSSPSAKGLRWPKPLLNSSLRGRAERRIISWTAC